jgi:hypothetical protein
MFIARLVQPINATAPRIRARGSKQHAVFLTLLARHNEERLHMEALIVWTQAFCVVLIVHIHQFLAACHAIDWHIVITPVLQNYQPAVNPP